MQQARNRLGADVIGKMSGPMTDAVLEFLRITPAHQHVHVKIGFNDQRGGQGTPFHGFHGHMAQVCHQDEQLFPAADGIAHALGGVVRHFKVLNVKVRRNGIPDTALQILPAGANPFGRERMAGKGAVQHGCGPNRHGQALAERAQAADMVPVVVGNKDGRYILHAKPYHLQFLFHPAETHPGVYENAGRRPQQEGTVAATATGETDKTHHSCSSSLQ